ncbi:hypothetical protein [Scytonema sp. NUACC26]|uniref:hypothetical protein n=1 Tax=Scytonema sp. NUACC26 TaxID=3140176 RepID=UPI0034DC871B
MIFVLPIIIAAARLIAVEVAWEIGKRTVGRFAVKKVGKLIARTGLKLGFRKAGKASVNVIKSGSKKIGFRRFLGMRIAGFLTAGMILAGFVGGLLTTIWTIAISTTHFILNFNINQSDNELYEALENRIKSFYGLLGTTVGSATGYLVCGAIPGAMAFAFNPAVGAAVMKDLDDEAKSEILGHVNGIARTAFQTLINAELTNKFMSTRRFLKKNPDNPFSQFVRAMIGEDNWKHWGESNRKSFTIQQDIIEKRIEKIKDPGWKSFLENALEEFGDSCMEAGYIVANNLDSQLAAYSLMQRQVLGQPVEVQLLFNDDDNDIDKQGDSQSKKGKGNNNRHPEKKSTNTKKD